MGKRVLVVDDDPDIRLFNLSVVEEYGYTGIEAPNGEVGEQMIRDDPPDLVILDVLMPKESGIRLFRRLKTDPDLKHIPVIMVSGIAEKSFRRSQKVLTEFDGDPVPEPAAYLEKPVEPEELGETVRRFLG
jgi:two-component system phosphate regulon response regulator PhoB